MRMTRRAALASLAACLAAPADSASGIRFTHAYGETVLPRPARRVVSLGYTTQDALLALGVPPLAIRQWYGPFPFGVWPWAQPYLNGAQPLLISGEVSAEVVAALEPDLIVGIGSGISQAEYAVLSRIAPVLMQDAARSAYGTPWDELTRTLGRALGKEAAADDLIAQVRQRFAEATARHPAWSGQTAVAAYHGGGRTGAFVGADTRARFLAELGFRPTPEVERLSAPQLFYTDLSPEDLSPLDADVLVWVSAFEKAPDLVALPMRRTLRAYAQGREVFAGALLAGAMSFCSVLSLPFALSKLEDDIAAASDGTLGTAVPSAKAAGLAP
ncbi:MULTISPECIES: ABC transporter substrate-binding protein [Rhodomicrobium]|uniref:ABC transporter substrate-binding protein n=1 Tax=Rhodomicrobium TaxID=1068 RepID=UPI000B4BB765|nr:MULTISPECIES: ABC transporter substrate-binding protein [Rhodomicrobium]